MTEEETPSEIVCPRCALDLHGSCDGSTLLEETEEFVTCECWLAGHERCFFCEEFIESNQCLEGRNHCEACAAECAVCGPDRAQDRQDDLDFVAEREDRE